MAVDWSVIARYSSAPRIEHWTRPAPLVLMAATAVSDGALDAPAGRWLVAAMLFGAVGDVALVVQAPRRFLAGLVAFLIGHLAYVVSFLELGTAASPWLAVGGAAVVLVAVIGPLVARGAARREGAVLGVAVTVYMLVIAAMVVLGSATGLGWVAVGALVFLASDAMIGITGFVRELTWSKLPIVVTYHVGQGLIALGVLLALNS